MAYVLLGRATCERHGISNTLIPGLPPLSSSRRQRKGPPLLCQVLCRRHSALLLLGFGSGGLRKQAASLLEIGISPSRSFPASGLACRRRRKEADYRPARLPPPWRRAIMSRVSFPQMLLGIGLAFIAGLIVGWERTSHGRAAGLRTTILACVAAAIAMVISEDLFAESGAATAGGNWRPNPARLGTGILTGIGFLGAGTIIRHENTIRGVTTATTLWFVTVLGLAFGSGQFAVGFMGMAVAMAALFILPSVEQVIQSD